MIDILELDEHGKRRFGSNIAALEGDIEYPLGADHFRIDHGRDYFAFFERLGELSYFIARDGERIVGVLAAVKRADGVWYLCDLKVPAAERGQGISRLLGQEFVTRKFTPNARAYAVSMNPEGSSNHVVTMLENLPFAAATPGAQLVLYSLDADTMQRCLPALVERRGPVSFLSLGGTKDIVLRSTGAPMPLLHAQFGRFAEAGGTAPRLDHVHMFCTPSDDPLVADLTSDEISPSATATVVHQGMAEHDWGSILTSDI